MWECRYYNSNRKVSEVGVWGFKLGQRRKQKLWRVQYREVVVGGRRMNVKKKGVWVALIHLEDFDHGSGCNAQAQRRVDL